MLLQDEASGCVEQRDLRDIMTAISGTSLVFCLFLFISMWIYCMQLTSSEWLTILVGCWGPCSSSSSSQYLATWGDWTLMKDFRQRHSAKSLPASSSLTLAPFTGLLLMFGLYNVKKDPLPREREKARWGIDTMWTLLRVSNCRYFFSVMTEKIKPFTFCFIILILFHLIAQFCKPSNCILKNGVLW